MSQRVDLSGFSVFLNGQRTKIAAAYKEIEELQKLYQGSYTRFKADHDKTLLALVKLIESSNEIGAALKPPIDARTPAERQAIEQRLADLKKKLPEFEKQADKLLARAQKEAADLRDQNPKLNDQEEQLKAQIVECQKNLDEMNAQIKRLGNGLGFISNAFKIHTLDRQRFMMLGRLEELGKNLGKVRQEWKELREMVQKEEMDWHGQWQAVMTQIGQLRQEQDYLTQNTDAQAHHRAIVYVIDNLKALPSGADATTLKPMIDLNIQTDDFQTALGSVAGILGVLKGVDDGLGRMTESVNALIAEQQKNSAYLPALNFDLDDGVIAFGKTWDDLIAKSKDEKTLATHPADFVAVIKPFLDTRLTKEHIAAFFDALGKAIKQATVGWRGK